jgi:hypothetical protein
MHALSTSVIERASNSECSRKIEGKYTPDSLFESIPESEFIHTKYGEPLSNPAGAVNRYNRHLKDRC